MSDDKKASGGPVRLVIDSGEPADVAAVIAGEEEAPRHGGNVTEHTPKDRSEIALARFFALKHAEERRNTANLEWLRYDGTRWVADRKRVIEDVKAICCEKAKAFEEEKPGVALQLKSDATVSAVERLARSDPKLAATDSDFDRDPWLLNTPGGVVDLRKGIDSLRQHRPADMMRKATSVAPGGLTCPNFKSLMDHITDGDAELYDWLWRAAGYMATGLTNEQVFFFLSGIGGSGKSKWVNAIAGALGDYATQGAEGLFLEPRGERHSTDLAAIQGYRLVTSTEIDQGRYWWESRLKQVVAGDMVTARKMRQDNVTFAPICKILIAGNFRPHMRDTGESMRRRLRLIPMRRKVADVDLFFEQKLRQEFPAILAWMIEGAVEWSLRGLHPPEAVRDAVDDYFREDDIVTQWLEEACVREPGARERTGVLYASFDAFAVGHKVPAMSINSLSSNLGGKGFRSEKGGKGVRWIKGLRVMTPAERAERTASSAQGDLLDPT